MKKLSVGIVGCGVMGEELCRFVHKEFKDQLSIKYLSEHHLEKAEALKKKLGLSAKCVDLPTLFGQSDFVIESAHPEAAKWLSSKALKKTKWVFIMSVGGVVKNIKDWLNYRGDSKLWCPSGALSGIDAILGAREGKITKVILKTRKSPKSLKGAPYFEKNPLPKSTALNKPYLVFKGTASEAVRLFPKNINVSMVLSLAGVGARRTQVEIWTSNRYKTNTHEVVVEGDFGKLTTITENKPSLKNPKTSALAILSAKAALRKIFSRIQVGT